MIRRLTLLLLAILVSDCGAGIEKKTYLLAERLWSQGNYAASVREFEKVTARDPKGGLGLQALYRGAMTQTLFLGQHLEAVRKFETYVQTAGDTETSWLAQKEIGEIWYTKLSQFDRAISLYEEMIRKNPTSTDIPEIRFRLAKAHFFRRDFKGAFDLFTDLQKLSPKTSWGERAGYEAGLSLYTGGESEKSPQAFQQAVQTLEKFIAAYPNSKWAPDARFTIACAWEEMDQMEKAIQSFQSVLKEYPAKKVVLTRISRLQQRLANRARSK